MAKNRPNRLEQPPKKAATILDANLKSAPQDAPIAPTKTPTKTPVATDFWLNALWHKIIIFCCGCLLYVTTLGYEHTIDDAIVITDNMHTQQGIAGIGGILGKDTFHGFFRDDKKLVEGGRYRPLSLVLFAVEMQFFGKTMKDKKGADMKSPMSGDLMRGIEGIGHFGNMLLYSLTGVLLYMLILLLLQRNVTEPSRAAHIIAFATGLLFITHPVHTEAVANIKGCDEILSLLGSLGALYLALKSFYKPNALFLALSGVAFFLACMAKENAITFLAIAPLAFYFFSNASLSQIAKQNAPLFIGAAAFIAVRSWAIGSQFGATPMELMNNPFVKLGADGLYHAVSFGEKMGTITYTLGKYLGLLFYPAVLTHDYYPRHIDLMDFSNSAVLLSAGVYIALIAAAVYGTTRRSAWAFGIWFYLLSLSIVSNVVFPVGTNMAERFLYMPSVGFAFTVAYLLYQLLKNNQLVFVGIISVSAMLFGYRTLVRNPAWYDNWTLFMTDGETSLRSAKLQNACGGELQRIATLTDRERLQWLGEAENVPELAAIRALPDSNVRQKQLLQEAVKHLDNALGVHPTYGNAWLLKGNAYYYMKNYPEAIKCYKECLRLQAEEGSAKRNLGCALRDYGRVRGEQQHDAAAAETLFAEAVTYLPTDGECYRLLGVSRGIQGKNDAALSAFQEWAKNSPNDANAYANLAIALRAKGDAAGAAAAQAKAQQLSAK